MKKFFVFLFLMMVPVFWMVEGCSPTPTDETSTETQSESTANEPVQESSKTETRTDAGSTEKPATEPKTEPAAEPKTEPAQESAQEKVSEPAAEPTSEPTQEPVAEGGTNESGGNETATESTSEQTSEASTPDGGGTGETSVSDGGSVETSPTEGTTTETPPKPTFTWKGIVFDFFTANNPPISGVKVCVYQTTNCVTTGANGDFKLTKLSQTTDYYISFEKTGLMPTIVPINVPAASIDGNGDYNHRVGMLAEQTAKLVATLMGIPNVDLKNKAHVAADVHDSKLTPTAGVSITMTPKNGQGPFYITASGTKNPKPETSSAGIAVFFDITPGTYEFAYKHASKTCTAWPSTIKNTNGSQSKATLPKGFLIVTSGLCK